MALKKLAMKLNKQSVGEVETYDEKDEDYKELDGIFHSYGLDKDSVSGLFKDLMEWKRHKH